MDLTLFSVALCDDHTPRASHRLHFDISWLISIQIQILPLPELGLKSLKSCLEFELFLTITLDSTAKCVFLKIELQNPLLNRVNLKDVHWTLTKGNSFFYKNTKHKGSKIVN